MQRHNSESGKAREKQSPLLKPEVVWEDTIRHRAYGLYLLRGVQEGHALDDWLQAEREVADGYNG